MKEPINNIILRVFWSVIPLGIVVWVFDRFGRFDDSIYGIEGWARVYSLYGDQQGAKVLIRKPNNKRKIP